MLLGATLLVTLPVLPLHIMGNSSEFDWKHISQLGHDLLIKLKLEPVNQVAQTAPMKDKTAAVDDVGLVQHAEAELLAKIQKQPDEPSSYNQLGLIYASAGDYDKAAVCLQKAVEVSRLRASQLAQSEAEYRAHGYMARATQAMLDRSRVNIELSAARSSLARVYDLLGQHEKVAAQLEQLNRDIAFGSALTVKINQTSVGIGAASAANHKMSQTTLSMLAKAEGYMQEHRVPEAVAQYKRVVAYDPLCYLAHERLGAIAMSGNNCYLALQELQIASRLEPDDANMHNSLGSAYQQAGENDRAIEEYEKAMSLKANMADAAFNLGNILCAAGRYKQAEEAFAKLAKINPDSADVHSNLATVMSMNGNDKGAIDEYQHALSLQPDLASAHYGLGLALYHSKSYPASIRELKKALAINPGLVDAQEKLRIAYKKVGTIGGDAIN
ncbi:MAG TPA: tetratricopeptide repeat protein [Planktothrix sp.]